MPLERTSPITSGSRGDSTGFLVDTGTRSPTDRRTFTGPLPNWELLPFQIGIESRKRRSGRIMAAAYSRSSYSGLLRPMTETCLFCWFRVGFTLVVWPLRWLKCIRTTNGTRSSSRNPQAPLRWTLECEAEAPSSRFHSIANTLSHQPLTQKARR